MRKTEELYWLIKKLEPQEKSYFKKFTQKLNSEEDNKYVLLFDEINALNTPEEINGKKFQTLIVKKELGNYLSDQKNHLVNMIMKAMRNFHGNKNADMLLKDMWKDLQFYKDRDLAGPYYKMILKIKNLAIESERHKDIIDICDEEIYYYGKYNLKSNISGLKQLFLEKEKHINLFCNIHRLKRIKRLLFEHNKDKSRTNFELDDSDTIFLNSLTEEQLQSSFLLASNFYVINYTMSHLAENYIESYEWSKKMMNLYSIYPEFRNNQLNAYYNRISNHLVLAIKAADYNTAIQFIEELKRKNIIPKSHSLYLEIMRYELSIGLHTRNLSNLDVIVNNLLESINDKNSVKKYRSILTTYYHIALAYFIVKDFIKVKEFSMLIQNFDIEVKQPNYYKSKILLLICYFELNDFENAQDAVRNMRREKNFTKYLQYVHEDFFDFMKELIKSPQDKFERIINYSKTFKGIDDIAIWFEHYQVPVS